SLSSLRTRWAVSKPRGSVRFSEKRTVADREPSSRSFFSRLAAMRRKDQGVIGISLDEEEDIQCVQENSERQDLADKVNKEIKVSHPICYDTNTLKKFNVALLRAICSHFEIPVKLSDKLSDVISD
ncbi:hypothetical protein pdam_00022937, partial [Pocillopora damicornis]